MNYLVLKLISRNADSILEQERIRTAINKKLVLEHVDDTSIFWDEDGDLIFHPPLHRQDKGYWLSVLNSVIDKKRWEFILGHL